ncbi:MAG: hypothetical protein ABW024_10545, partial [Microbacterium sp.]
MAEPRTSSPSPVLAFLRRIPATLAFIVVLLTVGVVFAGLWSPFEESPVFDVVAYGLPALSEGRWWTPVTGTFFVNQPWVYGFTIVSFAGMAYLEFRRGSRVALLYFWIGQLFAIFASALLLWVLSFAEWTWATTEAVALDVGASGGTMACIAASVGLFAAPWRVRAWLVLLAFVFIAMLFWGELADLEHAFAVLLILFVDRSLRLQRQTVREQRLIAFVAISALAVIELITLVVPTNGPFGPTEPASGGIWDVAIDVVIIVFVANGVRRGRRWAWVVSVVLASINILLGAAVLALVVITTELQVESVLDGETELAIATGFLWLLVLVYLVWVRGAFRARRRSTIGASPAPTADDVKAMLRADGGGTLSWMTTWDGNSYARTSSGIVAYQKRAGVAL